MRDFVAIDFETANPKRVSACAIGYAKVVDCKIVESKGFLVKPVGGHAQFQSKIHGIKAEHTCNSPDFKQLFPDIKEIFGYPLVAHSLFDKQVLIALSKYFSLNLEFEYVDSSAIAKQKLPLLKNCKLKTLAKHFGLPAFRHHDALSDAEACADIYLKLVSDLAADEMVDLDKQHRAQGHAAEQVDGSSVTIEFSVVDRSEKAEESNSKKESDFFQGLVAGILADDIVNYKEAYQLLYWLDDHQDAARKYPEVFMKLKKSLEDDLLDENESKDIKSLLRNSI